MLERPIAAVHKRPALALTEAVRHAGAMDQLGELLVSTTDAGASVPLRLVPVGGGQFLLAKLTEDPPDAVGLVGDASPGDEELKVGSRLLWPSVFLLEASAAETLELWSAVQLKYSVGSASLAKNVP